MQVNKVDYAGSFRAKGEYTRVIKGQLQDNTEALIRLTSDKCNNFRQMECIIHDGKGRVKGGVGIGKMLDITKDIKPFLEEMNTRAQKGIDFLAEFMNAMKA